MVLRSLRTSPIELQSRAMERLGTDEVEWRVSNNTLGSATSSERGADEDSQTRTASENPMSSGSSSELDMVDELVEQALVDNLLEGNITYSGIRPSVMDESSESVVIGGGGERTLTATAASGGGGEEARMSAALSDLAVCSGNGGVASSVSTTTTLSDTQNASSPSAISTCQDFIDIFVRFVNEREIKLRVKPDDTISLLKRYFF